jgi:hypothetical protein
MMRKNYTSTSTATFSRIGGKAAPRIICPHCHGTGKVPFDATRTKYVPCAGCAGTGFRQ